MRCIVARYKDRVHRAPLRGDRVSIGRSPENDLVLPYPSISRRHADVHVRDSAAFLVDTGSKNGLFHDGRRQAEVPLLSGALVALGPLLVTLEDWPDSDLELALTFPFGDHGVSAVRNAPETDTDGEEWRRGSVGGAMSLVRRIESQARLTAVDVRRSVLREALGLTGADGIAAVDLSALGAPALSIIEGVLPPEDTLRLATESRPEQDTAFRAQLVKCGPTHCIIAGNGRSALVAVFPTREIASEEWKRDFLGYVASKTLPAMDDASEANLPEGEPSEPQVTPLRFPPQMIVGPSAPLTGLLDSIRATVRSRLDVLLLGETGTGKELFARLIHDSGPNASGPFVPINCAAIPAELLESELFGVHGRVATGVDPRPGLFLAANGGTIFLDEVSELSNRLEAKLLRVIQEREVLPLGGKAPRKIDVRVISASNQDLAREVREGRFRADLYYRLRGLQFHIPPLRERRADIPSLVVAFAERAAREAEKRIRGVSRRALEILMSHTWPGNVRELEAEVKRAVLMCPDGGTLDSDHFATIRWLVEQSVTESRAEVPLGPTKESPRSELVPTFLGDGFTSLRERFDAVERQAIEEALRRSRGNRTAAAKLLGITRNGLALKLRRWGSTPTKS